MASENKTRKSYKQALSGDKPHVHVDGNRGVKKATGGGGNFTWGWAGDDEKYLNVDYHALDKRDPNYDPMDPREGQFRLSAVPPETDRIKFAQSIADLANFKRVVRTALDEYLLSYDSKEFIRCVNDVGFSIYHQDIPNIVVRIGLEKTDEQRLKIAALLTACKKGGLITPLQMAAGFRKLFTYYEDLTLDTPKAKVYLLEFVNHAAAAGDIEAKVASTLETLCNSKTQDFGRVKKLIDALCEEYLVSADAKEAARAVQELNAPHFHFEVVKRLISKALDRKDKERELASQLLADLAGSVIETDELVKGFTILLNRVEDLFLDVPDVLVLLSLFIARAVVDEALPPAFLVRVDLAQSDMGFRVVAHAQTLLAHDGAPRVLAKIWCQPPSGN